VVIQLSTWNRGDRSNLRLDDATVEKDKQPHVITAELGDIRAKRRGAKLDAVNPMEVIAEGGHDNPLKTPFCAPRHQLPQLSTSDLLCTARCQRRMLRTDGPNRGLANSAFVAVNS
jgi:hypothetical protein